MQVQKQNRHTSIEAATQPNFLLVREDFMMEILEKQNQIIEMLSVTKKVEEPLGDYITEAQAKKYFGRGTTWFWNQRKAGLAFTKVGPKVFYAKADLLNLIEGEKKR